MDDFNADNAKLDAALKAEEAARTAAVKAEEAARKSAISTVNNSIATTNQLVRLVDFTTSSAAKQFNVRIGNINWAAYGEVLLYIRLYCAAGLSNVDLTLDGNASESGYYFREGISYGTQAYLMRMMAAPGGEGVSARIPYTRLGFAAEWSGAAYGTEIPTGLITYCYKTRQLRSQYSTFNFTSDAALDAGCRVVMQGVKL